MQVPEGIPNLDGKICRLKKSLYGLKQASRQWFANLCSALQMRGFQQSKNGSSLFIKKRGSLITIATIYVDDIMLIGSDLQKINELKKRLHQALTIKDIGKLHYFWGLETVILNKELQPHKENLHMISLLNRHVTFKTSLYTTSLTFQTYT